MIQLTDTKNIFSDDKNFYILIEDKDKHLLPPTNNWDYKRPITLEDVELWEVIYEIPAYIGVYASYKPMCEFYMIVPGPYLFSKISTVEFFYGPEAEQNTYNRCKSLGINLETSVTSYETSSLPHHFYNIN